MAHTSDVPIVLVEVHRGFRFSVELMQDKARLRETATSPQAMSGRVSGDEICSAS